MARFTSYFLAALAAPAALVSAAPACDSCTERVIVVRMGEEPASSSSSAVAATTLSPVVDLANKKAVISSSSSSSSAAAAAVTSVTGTVTSKISSATTTVIVQPTAEAPQQNSTKTYVPYVPQRQIEVAPAVRKMTPSQNVSMEYGAVDDDDDGKISMALNMTSPAILLESIDGVGSVSCPTGSIIVSFTNADDYTDALKEWALDDDLVMITNHGGNCDHNQERGFYVGTSIIGNAAKQAITIKSRQVQIADIAESLEMSFSSVPGGSLSKRISVAPSTELNFGKSLPNDTVLYTDNKYLTVKAEEAQFNTTIKFSGKLNYNFWGFKLEELYFDLDVAFETDLALSAEIKARYMQVFKYAPQELSYSFVSIPGIIQLGPAVQFAIGAEFDVDAALDASAELHFAVPDGKVHVDVLNGNNTKATGWDKPVYSAAANISENAVAHINPDAEVTVQLAFKLLGGLIDLSSGISVKSTMANTFQLVGDQGAGVGGVGNAPTGDITLPTSCSDDIDNGIALKSDLDLVIKGFATKYWSMDIYKINGTVLDKCWALPKINGTNSAVNNESAFSASS